MWSLTSKSLGLPTPATPCHVLTCNGSQISKAQVAQSPGKTRFRPNQRLQSRSRCPDCCVFRASSCSASAGSPAHSSLWDPACLHTDFFKKYLYKYTGCETRGETLVVSSCGHLAQLEECSSDSFLVWLLVRVKQKLNVDNTGPLEVKQQPTITSPRFCALRER